MLTFFEMYQLLESDNINEADNPLDLLKKFKEKLQTDKQKAATEPSSLTSPATPQAPKSKKELGPKENLPQGPVSSASKFSNIPPAPIKTKAEKDEEESQFSQVNAEKSKPHWQEPEDPQKRIEWFNNGVEKLFGNQGDKHKTQEPGFNDFLKSKTYQFWTRFGLKHLGIPFQAFVDGKPLPKNTLPNRSLYQGKLQISINNSKGIKAEFPEIVLSMENFLNLYSYVMQTLKTKRELNPDWSKIDKGKPVRFADYLMHPAIENEDMEDLCVRAVQFEHVLLHPSIVDRKFTVHGLAEELNKLVGPVAGGLENIKVNDVKVVGYMIDMAKKAGFNLFETNGDPSNPKTMVTVSKQPYMQQTNPEMEKGEKRAPIAQFQAGRNADRYRHMFLTQPKNLIKNPDEIQPESKQWVDLMTVMEHWDF